MCTQKISAIYVDLNELDSSYYFLKRYEEYVTTSDSIPSAIPNLYGYLAWYENNRGNYEKAIALRKKGIIAANQEGEPYTIAMHYSRYGRLLTGYDVVSYKDEIDSIYSLSEQIFVGSGLDEFRKDSYAILLNYRGMYHFELYELDSAEFYFQKAYEINLEFFGNNNLATLDNLNNLAGIQFQNEKHIAARENFLKCWHIANDLGISYTQSLNYYQNYATTFNLTNDFEKAAYKLDSVISFREKKLPNAINELNHARTKLVTALKGLKRYERAETILRQIIEEHLEKVGENGNKDLAATIRLIKLKLITGDTAEARQIQVDNHNNITKRLGASSPLLPANDTLIADLAHYL